MSLKVNLGLLLERRDPSKALVAIDRDTLNAGYAKVDDRQCLDDENLIITMAIGF